MSFISLDDARTELRIDDELQDDYLTRLIARTDTILLTYLDMDTEDDFYYEYADGAKRDIMEAAAAMVIRSLYDDGDANPLTPAVKALLAPVRTPRCG